MRFVCLWSPGWSIGEGPGDKATSSRPESGAAAESGAGAQGLEARLAELPAVLAEVAPRLRVEPGRVWVDGRGLPPGDLAAALLHALVSIGVHDARAGLAEAPVVAWAACSPWAGMAGEGPWRGAAEGGTPAASRSWTSSGRHETSGSEVVSAARLQRVPVTAADAPVAPSPTPPLSPSSCVLLVPPGEERRFLAPLPLAVLDAEGADPHVLELLAGVGVETCGALAALEREGVEVRFGVEGLRLWRLARGDDPRLLFQAVPPERPQASLDFVDYVVTDPERLAFTVNALLGSICDGLRERGEHARRLLLVLELAGGGRWEQGLRPGRATASRAIWLRLARMALDRTTLPDAVSGVRLEVEATEPAGVRQGDLFDTGFATAPAVEAAVLRLLESQGEVVVRPVVDGHPLAERRVSWAPVGVDEVVSATAPEAGTATTEGESGGGGEGAIAAPPAVRRSWAAGSPRARRKPADAVAHSPTLPLSPSAGAAEERLAAAMTLQLLKQPREIRVETELRRDHGVPVRYHERGAGWQQVVSVAGPDRVSGGAWEGAYAREYFRVVTAEGLLVWLFRDARRGTWYLHGWWD